MSWRVIRDQPKGTTVALKDRVIHSVPTNLHSLTPLTFLQLKHDRDAECCSSKSYYQLLGLRNEILLMGYSDSPEYCGSGRSPIFIKDMYGTAIIQIQIGTTNCCSSKNKVEISAPPGNPIGTIWIKDNLYTSNQYEIWNISNGQKFSVEKKIEGLSGCEYLFRSWGYNKECLAAITHEDGKFRLQISTKETVDVATKANLIGFMIMLDVFHEEEDQTAGLQGLTLN